MVDTVLGELRKMFGQESEQVWLKQGPVEVCGGNGLGAGPGHSCIMNLHYTV